MEKKTCIGCDKPCKDGLCAKCESALNALEKALAGIGQKLELVSVKIKD